MKIAFLNGDLEEVFMCPPPGFEKIVSQNKLNRLKKSLDFLKQPPWHDLEGFGRQ